MERLGKVLAEDRASEDKLKPVVASAVALLLLTGCRVGEILNLQWSDCIHPAGRALSARRAPVLTARSRALFSAHSGAVDGSGRGLFGR